MSNTLAYTSAYPGNYAPILQEDEVKQQCFNKKSFYLPIRFTELSTLFKVEIPIPGVKRDELYLCADENDVSLYVLSNNISANQQPGAAIPNNAPACFDQHILLPENADTEFSYAEYYGGVLRLHVPKTKYPVKNTHARIVVY
ncbi:MAG TPA: Hsp20/alpha crystallin family protein [Chitinophagaceae bacterium]|nr:Hsp20/alpha crystallin family protein [Chitinophagaceae bacterium]